MFTEEKVFSSLDLDLQLELQRKLNQLQAEYDEKRKIAVSEICNLQKERESTKFLSETPPDSISKRPVRRCTRTKSKADPTLSPVLCQSSKKRKPRKFFPHISNSSLKLLTSSEAVREFALPETFVATVNENTFVCNSKKSEEINPKLYDKPNKTPSDPLFDLLSNKMKLGSNVKENHCEVSRVCLASYCSKSYVAIISSDFMVKVFSKSDQEKWREYWNLNSENEIDEIRWMQKDNNSLYLLTLHLKPRIIRLYNLHPDKEITSLCELEVQGLSCVSMLPGCQLVACGEKMCTYSLDHHNRQFVKEMTFMSPDCTVTSLAAIDLEPKALLGSSQSHYYVWNLSNGCLLQQFEVQLPGDILFAQNIQGSIRIHIVSATSIGLVIVNPSNRKQFVSSRDRNEEHVVIQLSSKEKNRLTVTLDSALLEILM